MTDQIFQRDPFSVIAPSTDRSTGAPSTPTGTLAAWATINGGIVPATAVSATGTTITVVFEGGLPAGGGWRVYVSEAVDGGLPGVIVEHPVAIAAITRGD